jgi:hypothetical protein
VAFQQRAQRFVDHGGVAVPGSQASRGLEEPLVDGSEAERRAAGLARHAV